MIRKTLLAGLLSLIAVAPVHADWTNCGSNANLKQLSVRNGNEIWGVSFKNQIFKFNGRSWKNMKIGGKQVSVAKDGSLAILSTNNGINVRSKRGGLSPIPGILSYVSRAHGGNGGMWGVNSKGEIYAYNAPNWTRLTGALSQVSVGADSSVFGVNSGGNVYLWGTRSGQWSQVSNGLSIAEVSCASSSNVWAVSTKGSVYRYTGRRFVPVSGKLAHIAVGYDGSVYGLTGRGQMVRYDKTPVKKKKTKRPTPRPTPTPTPTPKKTYRVIKVVVKPSVSRVRIGQSVSVKSVVYNEARQQVRTGRCVFSAKGGRMEGSTFVATNPGRATIRVTHLPSRVSGTCVINVVEPIVCKRVTLTASQQRVYCGGRVKLSCAAFDQNNRPMNVSTEFVVEGAGGRVEGGVFIAGNRAGRSKIIAINRQYNVRSVCVVDIIEPVRLSVLTFETQVCRVRCGQGIQLSLKGWDQNLRPCRVRGRRLTWKSSGGKFDQGRKVFSSNRVGRFRVVVRDSKNPELIAVAHIYVDP